MLSSFKFILFLEYRPHDWATYPRPPLPLMHRFLSVPLRSSSSDGARWAIFGPLASLHLVFSLICFLLWFFFFSHFSLSLSHPLSLAYATSTITTKQTIRWRTYLFSKSWVIFIIRMPSQPSRYQTFLQVPTGLGKERGRPRLPEAATLDPLPQLISLVPKNRYIVSNHWNRPQTILWAPLMEYRDIGTSNLFSWCSVHSMVTRAVPWAAGADSISTVLRHSWVLIRQC